MDQRDCQIAELQHRIREFSSAQTEPVDCQEVSTGADGLLAQMVHEVGKVGSERDMGLRVLELEADVSDRNNLLKLAKEQENFLKAQIRFDW